MPLLEVQHVQKIYTTRFGGTQVQALSNVSFSVEEGEYVAIMGESGSGKTTLLNILAALDRPTAGEVLLEGRPLSAIRERDLAAFRRSHLGFVFQDFNLLDTFSLQDNIYLPLVLAGTDYREMQQKLRPRRPSGADRQTDRRRIQSAEDVPQYTGSHLPRSARLQRWIPRDTRGRRTQGSTPAGGPIPLPARRR